MRLKYRGLNVGPGTDVKSEDIIEGGYINR